MKASNGEKTARNRRVALAIVLLGFTDLAAMTAYAGDCGPCARVRKNVQASLPGTAVGEIRRAPIRGLFEIQMGRNIAYTDRHGKLFLMGHIYDPATRRDLTAERLAEVNRVSWKDLPLKDAIVSGPEDGTRLAVFTDPECPYCKHLEKILRGMPKVRVYTFLFPLTSIHPDARAKAEAIWCAKDRHAALLDVMLNGKQLKRGACATPIDRNIQLAQKLGINGTPGLIAPDGRVMQGAPDSAVSLAAWLRLPVPKSRQTGGPAKGK